jgi:hypothetical protein
MQTYTCINCEKQIKGRPDKKYCSSNCKNQYNYNRRKQTKSETKAIDSILHRNREILDTLMGSKRVKMEISKTELTLMGFQYKYFTGTHINKVGKLYHIVYNFAWMEFTQQKVLIIKDRKLK